MNRAVNINFGFICSTRTSAHLQQFRSPVGKNGFRYHEGRFGDISKERPAGTP